MVVFFGVEQEVPAKGRTPDQQDASVTAEWLRRIKFLLSLKAIPQNGILSFVWFPLNLSREQCPAS